MQSYCMYFLYVIFPTFLLCATKLNSHIINTKRVVYTIQQHTFKKAARPLPRCIRIPFQRGFKTLSNDSMP